MSIEIKTLHATDINAWDTYVSSHPDATLYHLAGWKDVIEKTYGHKTYYLMALRPTPRAVSPSSEIQPTTHNEQLAPAKPVGILPLVHLKHFLFGNSLISVPFLDYGGILADDQEVENALLEEAIKIGKKVGIDFIELRNIELLQSLNPESYGESNLNLEIRTHKVRMILELPGSSDELMKSFKSKLKSQIRRPLKEGLTAAIGGVDLLDDFYKVFSINMRDLGSPVHSKKLIQNVLEVFFAKARIVVIYKDKLPVACSIIIGFRDTLENPWASSLREFSRLAPNMLLYWTMLGYACDNGFNKFDFGRSTPDEGTYKFKEQWGARPESLHWQYISVNGRPIDAATNDKSNFDNAVHYWKKLPVVVTNFVGPLIRQHIGL